MMRSRMDHPLTGLAGTISGVGFWVSHAVVAIGVIALVLLEVFGVQVNGPREAVAGLATMVFGVAVLVAFGGWIARCTE